MDGVLLIVKSLLTPPIDQHQTGARLNTKRRGRQKES